jgi:hypothetical protein
MGTGVSGVAGRPWVAPRLLGPLISTASTVWALARRQPSVDVIAGLSLAGVVTAPARQPSELSWNVNDVLRLAATLEQVSPDVLAGAVVTGDRVLAGCRRGPDRGEVFSILPDSARPEAGTERPGPEGSGPDGSGTGNGNDIAAGEGVTAR